MAVKRFHSKTPFGQPDGSQHELDPDAVVEFDSRYGGLAADPRDTSVRAVVGQLGSGKSLLLRRMQAELRADRDIGLAAVSVEKSSELTTRDLNMFARISAERGEDSGDWKQLWRRAIARSAVSQLLNGPFREQVLHLDAATELRSDRYARLLGEIRVPEQVTQCAHDIIYEFNRFSDIAPILANPRWAEIEHHLATLLREVPGLFLFVDDVDKELKHAPSEWARCQRGLFYAVQEYHRHESLGSRLHVTISIRDIAFTSIKRSEHFARYVNDTNTIVLAWDWSAMRHFLDEKLHRLPGEYFLNPDDRSARSWLGFGTVHNAREISTAERVDDYLIRHTNLVPRDLVIMGNMICSEIRRASGTKPSESTLRTIVATCAGNYASRQIAQTANHILSFLEWDGAERIPLSPPIPPDEATGPGRVSEDPVVEDTSKVIRRAIARTQDEFIDRERLDELDAEVDRAFHLRGEARVSDVLWQQGILGHIARDSTRPRFYRLSVADDTPLEIPREPHVVKYAWSPLLLDLDLGLHRNPEAQLPMDMS